MKLKKNIKIMYLSEVIKPLIDKKLQEICINKKVSFYPEEDYNNLITITCKSVKFEEDDGDCWIKFTDENNNKYIVFGQGIDIYFEVIE